MGIISKLFSKKEKQDLRLMFIFQKIDKKTCALRGVEVVDLLCTIKSPIVKRYDVPKQLNGLSFDSILIEHFEHILTKLLKDSSTIEKLDVGKSPYIQHYANVIEKIKKKFGNTIPEVICGVMD